MSTPYAQVAHPSDPAVSGQAVTAGTAFARACRCLYVGGAGNLTVVMNDAAGTNLTFSSVPAGTFLPVSCTQVISSGLTASNILALW